MKAVGNMSSEPDPHVPAGAGVAHLLGQLSLVPWSVCLPDMSELCLYTALATRWQ